MHKNLGRHTVVLLGIGHTNAHVLRMWKMGPIANTELVCVSNFPYSTYSGMMPGVLAGQYPPEAMQIDLVRLCASANSRLIIGNVTGLDREHHRLEFADRPPLPFDVLSIGIGSVPTFQGVEVRSDKLLLAIKPMQTFLPRLKKLLSRVSETDRPLRIAIVGGGIGSIEVAFCLQRRLLSNDPDLGVDLSGRPDPVLTVITADQEVGSGLLESTRNKVKEQLKSRGIRLITDSKVKVIAENHLELQGGQTYDADVVIWLTGAAAPPLLSKLGLETNERGFLSTHSSLQTTSDDRIFAVGDTGTINGSNHVKAGVYAVRQGPFLWDNINRRLWHRPLQNFEPQKKFLKLINTADGKTIAEYSGLSFYAGWCWSLKDRIDSKFMAKYQDYEPMPMVVPEDDSDQTMRCLGCGGKIGSELLSKVLSELEIPQHDDVIIGLSQPDDASVVKTHDNRVTVTTDFFASPFDDPYLVGRIALLNSASDCFVMGAQPTAALSMVQITMGHPRAQLQEMRELMAGSVEELSKMGATLVGGHSIEGPRLMVGFTILGRQLSDPKTKGMLRSGDCLVMTKALGTGVLLAALMQCKLPGRAYQRLIDGMLQSNIIALKLIQEYGVTAITDVTGFGLAGHLAEMLQASHQSAEINLDKIPLLPGCQRLLDAGIESTLAPDNRLVAQKVHLEIDDLDSSTHGALFDPQTGGGLLMGVAAENVDRVIGFLNDEGFSDSVVFGQVGEPTDSRPTLTVRSKN